MKKVLFPVSVLLGSISIILAVAAIAISLALPDKPESTVANCTEAAGNRPQVVVTASDEGFAASTASTIQCAELTLINLGQERVGLAFGLHDDHYPYEGFVERSVRPGESISVTLAEAGTYRLHNHYHEEHFFTLNVRADGGLEQSAKQLPSGYRQSAN